MFIFFTTFQNGRFLVDQIKSGSSSGPKSFQCPVSIRRCPLNDTMPASSLCRLNVRACKWAPSSSIRAAQGSRGNWCCPGRISHTFWSQKRNLITAFTYCPTSIEETTLKLDPKKALITFIDATVAWAAQRHVAD